MKRSAPEEGAARGLLGRALDLVYPGVCHLCEENVEGGASICHACADALPGVSAPFCATCGEGFDGVVKAAFDCPNCHDQDFAFEFARPALVRSSGTMALVHDLKYGRRLHLGPVLGMLARRAFEDPRLAVALDERWPLVPVPLHSKRKRWRHFNQAEEIARPLARHFGMPVVGALRRIRPTVTQTRLSRSQRQKNLKGAFEVVRGYRPTGGAVLVDDVFTTGSTVHECARILRKAGVQKVVVVTAMRG